MKTILFVILLGLLNAGAYAYIGDECYTMTVEDECVLRCTINGEGTSLVVLHAGICKRDEQLPKAGR